MRFLVRICVFWLIMHGCAISKPKNVNIESNHPQIDTLYNFQSNFINSRNITVWKPSNYSNQKKYAVIYMHDGQMLFDSSFTWNRQEWKVDETIESLIFQSSIRDVIVVAIDNNPSLRHAEYFPQKPFEKLDSSFQDSLINQVKRHGSNSLFGSYIQSDNYLKFIVKELKPFIDHHYSTRRNSDNTFIMGSSMGGLISIYAICEYPEVFGGAACLSTHWPGIFTLENNPIPESFITYLSETLPTSRVHKIYFDYGTETLDALYENSQLKVDSIMRRKGYSEKNWTTQKFNGADHSEKSWANRLSIPIIFLLSK